VPLEVARTGGPVGLNFEVGYYLPNQHGSTERILGFVAGGAVTNGLELDAELYNDHVMGSSPNFVTLDFGGRYKLNRSFILLFMAGRSLGGNAPGQVEFMGYLGVQILLSHYGTRLGGAAE
jgi:hypothetical protein